MNTLDHSRGDGDQSEMSGSEMILPKGATVRVLSNDFITKMNQYFMMIAYAPCISTKKKSRSFRPYESEVKQGLQSLKQRIKCQCKTDYIQ